MKTFFGQSTKQCVLLALLVLAASGSATAQERKAYRHVDAAGNVTYSQTPPVDNNATKQMDKIDISPAQRGRGGDIGSYSAYDNPQYYGNSYDRDRYSMQTQRPTVYDQRLAALKAECERQRGTDCNNPSTLQYLESSTLPRTGVVVRPAQRLVPRYPRRDG